MNYSNTLKYAGLTAALTFLTGCVGSMPTLGGGSGNAVTGAAAGSSSANKSSQLESCDKTLGTLRVFEDKTLGWWGNYRRLYPKLGTTVPVIRTMIQQSNCFVIVERGEAMKAMQRERALMNSGELRGSSNFGKGQMVAADFTLSPSVTFKQSNMGKITGAARNLLSNSWFGRTSVGAKSNEASTTILLIDNRSGVQISSSVGSAKNYDFSISGYSWMGSGWAGVNAFTDTAEGKVIIAAFVDSYNQMVKALRNYKPQKVKGGLGTGGGLEVDGQTKAKPMPKPQSKAKPVYVAPVAKTASVRSNQNINVTSNQSSNINVDAYDPNALNDYYRALKGAVANFSKFASMGPAQLKAIGQYNNTGIDLWTLLWSGSFSGEFETSKIELESWPLDARKKGWKILGKKIKKYNKLFYKHKKELLAGKDLTDDVRRKINGIELVTEKSLFES